MLDWLAAQTAARPDGVALVIGEAEYTYADLNARVDAACARLTALGVTPGMMVALLLPSRLETVVLIHALARLGAVLLALNTRLTAAEIDYQLEMAGCDLLICARNTEAAAAELKRQPLRIVTLDQPQTSRAEAWDAIPPRANWQPAPCDLERVQGVLFTSGTTGTPKGAQMTFANHFWSAMASAYRIGTLPDDRWLCPMPLYHVGGLAIILRCCLYGTTVVLQNGFQLDAIDRALDTQPISLMSVVPTMLYRLLKARESFPPSLRLILLGGAAASTDLLERCHERGLPVATTYGMTETATQVATMLPDDARRKPGSVGKPLLYTTVRIVDERGYSLPPGAPGEIVVSGKTVMRGYLHQQPTNGEIKTGDIGFLDEDGDLWLMDRRSDLIVSGGENIYPSEVESVLRSHPAVADACVVGVPDAEWGQRVAALVALRAGMDVSESTLIAYSRERLAGYKQPRLIRFIDRLPQTASGKIHRRAVLDTFLSSPT